MTHFLIDGYNYLHRAGLFDPDRLEESRKRLAERLRILRRRGDLVTIVWDARGGPPDRPSREILRSVENLFARSAGSADADILSRLRAADDARRFCVVSDDRDITRPARQLGARVRSVRDVEEWVGLPKGRGSRARLEPGDEKPPPPSRTEVEEWLRFFGEDGLPPVAGEGTSRA